MRRRALLLVLLAGGLAAAGSATLDSGARSGHDAPTNIAALARADLADVPAPGALSRTRDGLLRDHDARRDLAAAVALAFALTLAGGRWLARERAVRVLGLRTRSTQRTRAPPRAPFLVHC